MKYPFLLAILCSLAACSLDYGKSENVEDSIPEFRFTDAHLSRYEDNKPTMEVEAERIEQYKSDGSAYVQNAQFKTYDNDGNLDTEGSCDLLSAETKKERYYLFNHIVVNLYSQDMKIFADALRFDGKNEQITGGVDDAVSIEKKDTLITGKGFSASGVSKTFSFFTNVDGTIHTNDEETAAEDEQTANTSASEAAE